MTSGTCRNCGDVTFWGVFCSACVRAFVSGIATALGAALVGYLLGGG